MHEMTIKVGPGLGPSTRIPATEDPIRQSASGHRAPLFREALGAVLRALRTDSGRTLRDVADAARVSPGYLSELERGRKEASSELLAAISGALFVSLGEVLIRVVAELTPNHVEPDTVLAG